MATTVATTIENQPDMSGDSHACQHQHASSVASSIQHSSAVTTHDGGVLKPPNPDLPDRELDASCETSSHAQHSAFEHASLRRDADATAGLEHTAQASLSSSQAATQRHEGSVALQAPASDHSSQPEIGLSPPVENGPTSTKSSASAAASTPQQVNQPSQSATPTGQTGQTLTSKQLHSLGQSQPSHRKDGRLSADGSRSTDSGHIAPPSQRAAYEQQQQQQHLQQRQWHAAKHAAYEMPMDNMYQPPMPAGMTMMLHRPEQSFHSIPGHNIPMQHGFDHMSGAQSQPRLHPVPSNSSLDSYGSVPGRSGTGQRPWGNNQNQGQVAFQGGLSRDGNKRSGSRGSYNNLQQAGNMGPMNSGKQHYQGKNGTYVSGNSRVAMGHGAGAGMGAPGTRVAMDDMALSNQGHGRHLRGLESNSPGQVPGNAGGSNSRSGANAQSAQDTGSGSQQSAMDSATLALSSTTDIERFIIQVTPMISVDMASQSPSDALQALRLEDVWKFYLEPSLYGREVYTLGGARGPANSYFVPYISAMQLFTPAAPGDGGVGQLFQTDTDNWPKYMRVRFQHFEVLPPFVRPPLYDHLEQLAKDLPEIPPTQPSTSATTANTATPAPTTSSAAASNNTENKTATSLTASGQDQPGKAVVEAPEEKSAGSSAPSENVSNDAGTPDENSTGTDKSERASQETSSSQQIEDVPCSSRSAKEGTSDKTGIDIAAASMPLSGQSSLGTSPASIASAIRGSPVVSNMKPVNAPSPLSDSPVETTTIGRTHVEAESSASEGDGKSGSTPQEKQSPQQQQQPAVSAATPAAAPTPFGPPKPKVFQSWLRTMRITELHPASWYCVAWYPVYRIPDAPLNVRFLTFHSFAPLVGSVQNTIEALQGVQSGPPPPASVLPVPVVGIKWNNMIGEKWLEHLTTDKNGQVIEVNIPDDSAFSGFGGNHRNNRARPGQPRIDPALQAHLSELQGTAERLARGHGLQVVTMNGPAEHRQRHPDYDFFASRGS